jgi:hypothetical protein
MLYSVISEKPHITFYIIYVKHILSQGEISYNNVYTKFS